jgi:chromosome segregation ATPase
MDVTPKEEVLAAELKRLKDAFEKVSEQLDACRLENDLLKDHKRTLEHDRDHLEGASLAANDAVDKVTAELEQSQLENAALRTAAADREAELLAAVAEKDSQLDKARTEIASLRREHEAAAHRNDKLAGENKELHEKVTSIQRDNREQHETIARFYRDVEASRSNEAKLQRALEETKLELERQRKGMSEATKTTGTIATLAEDLKVKKVGLERLLSQREQTLAVVQSKEAKATARVAALQKRLEEVEASAASRMQYLEGCLEDQTNSLDVAQEERVKMEIQLTDLKNWLEQKSELEESLDEAFGDLEAAHGRLHELEGALEEAERDRAGLEAQRAKFAEAAAREEALHQKMIQQQLAFERRLEEIRTILGLKFAAAVHAEVRLLKNELPVSFRVPLLTAKHG